MTSEKLQLIIKISWKVDRKKK